MGAWVWGSYGCEGDTCNYVAHATEQGEHLPPRASPRERGSVPAVPLALPRPRTTRARRPLARVGLSPVIRRARARRARERNSARSSNCAARDIASRPRARGGSSEPSLGRSYFRPHAPPTRARQNSEFSARDPSAFPSREGARERARRRSPLPCVLGRARRAPPLSRVGLSRARSMTKPRCTRQPRVARRSACGDWLPRARTRTSRPTTARSRSMSCATSTA